MRHEDMKKITKQVKNLPSWVKRYGQRGPLYLKLEKAVLKLYLAEKHLSKYKLWTTCFRITWEYYLKHNLDPDSKPSQTEQNIWYLHLNQVPGDSYIEYRW